MTTKCCVINLNFAQHSRTNRTPFLDGLLYEKYHFGYRRFDTFPHFMPFNVSHPFTYVKGWPQNPGLFARKFVMPELGDFGDSNASGSEIYMIYNTVTET